MSADTSQDVDGGVGVDVNIGAGHRGHAIDHRVHHFKDVAVAVDHGVDVVLCRAAQWGR